MQEGLTRLACQSGVWKSVEKGLVYAYENYWIGTGAATITIGNYKLCMLSTVTFGRDGSGWQWHQARVYKSGSTWYAYRWTDGGSEQVGVGAICFN